MDYSRPELADRLAAEYALGTLRGGARRRFESLLLAHPALRQASADWERRLAQLAIATEPVPPSPRVWEGIHKRLFLAAQAMQDQAGVVTRWWQRLALWQSLTAGATVAAIALGVVLTQPTPAQPPIVVVMQASPDLPDGSTVRPLSFVASVSGDGRSLVVQPLSEGQTVAVNRALELWAVPPQGAPRSLGLVSPDRATTVLRTELLRDTAAFAVTLEPPGGAPGGKATGPIVSVGKLQL